MNPYKIIDRFVAQKTYKFLVRYETKPLLAMGFVPEVIAKQLYNKRSKDWKNWGITLKEIRDVVEDYCKVKPLHGIKLWVWLRKASLTIQNAIKHKRIVFLDNGKVEYTDKGYYKYKLTVDELADKFIEVTKQGFEREHIASILRKEQQKELKRNATKSG